MISTKEAPHLTPPHPLTNPSLITRFEQVASAHSHKVAVVLDDQTLTYAELNAQANRIAHRLLTLALPQPSIVGIWLERSPAMIAAMLGVLKAGHTYLPLEATYPAARIAQTLEDANPGALITEESLAAQLPTTNACLMFLSQHEARERNPEVALNPEAPAYILYTSGSTGKPKGVRVTHTNVLRLFDQTRQNFRFDHNDVWTMFHSFAFDFSVWEIWGPLLTGATLILVPFETTRSPEDFYRLLSTQHVTILNQTPSAFQLLSQVEDRGLSLPLDLRLVIFGGEALKFSSLKSWFSRHPDTRPQLVNMYGITETTVHVTRRNVTQADAHLEQESLIGTPIPDLTLHLLDLNLEPVGTGEIGELCIGGAGVSLGYLNRPELTAERFIAVDGQRLYRSGDVARRRADGELVYLGRRDDQVKISGFRIELGEVEAAIGTQPQIAQACVVAHTDDASRTQLDAYFTTFGGTALPVAALAQALKAQLPAHMLPASFTHLEAMPLTPNGKIDRKALPPPTLFNHTATHLPTGHEEAASEIEEAVLSLVRDVVGSQAIGLEDFFFSVGGHSLLGTQFVLRVRSAFGIKLALRDLFETETVREIAARVEELILEDIETMSEDEAVRQVQQTASEIRV
jgi:amino acid adenylation domain-containing protein